MAITNTAYQISFPFGQPLDMLGRYDSIIFHTSAPIPDA